MDPKTLAKKRRASNLWMMALLVITATLYRFTPEILAFLSGTRPEEIADIGIEGLQKGFIAMFYLPWAIAFSAAIASLVEPQLREDAFGSLSRWGVLFALMVLCFTLIVA
jgi:hypothetical protein